MKPVSAKATFSEAARLLFRTHGREIVRGILSGAASFVVNGKVIARGAKKVTNERNA